MSKEQHPKYRRLEANELLKRCAESEGTAVQAEKRLKPSEDQPLKVKKFHKKKVAILMAYSGKGYYGMQVCEVFCNIALPIGVVLRYLVWSCSFIMTFIFDFCLL